MKEEKAYHLPSGMLLQGRYRIDSVLGEGGFGITYSGTELVIGKKVAIKEYFPCSYAMREQGKAVLPKPDAASQKMFQKNREGFLEEARVLSRCASIESVVGVSAYFEENQTAYIVMEFLNGVTLKRLLDEQGTMSAAYICELMLPLIEDLGRIHALGFLHRDISMDNIMLLHSGRLKLMDFGAARDYDMEPGTGKSMTVMIKHGFAPFEQYTRHGNQGPWTDIYALSATIYTCITGIIPDSAPDRFIQDTLQPFSELGIGISPQLECVLLKGMSIHAQARFQNAEEMLNALRDALGLPVNTSAGIEAGGTIGFCVPDKLERERQRTLIEADTPGTNEELLPGGEVSTRKAHTPHLHWSAAIGMGLIGIGAVGLIGWLLQKPLPEDFALDASGKAATPVVAASPTPEYPDGYDVGHPEYYECTQLEDGTLAITKYIGAESKIVLPSSIDGQPVTAIRDNAFYRQNTLEEVVIPEGVVRIGSRAFGNCEQLTTVRIPGTVTEIGENPFVDCGKFSNLLLDEENTAFRFENGFLIDLKDMRLIAGIGLSGRVIIPEGTRTIGGSAFKGNERITEVIIPEGVTNVLRYAFYNCVSLSVVELPESAQGLVDTAFGSDFMLDAPSPRIVLEVDNPMQRLLLKSYRLEYTVKDAQ